MKKVKYILPVIAVLVVGTVILLNNINTSFAKDNTEDLKKQIEALQKKVDELESEKQSAQSQLGISRRRRVRRWDPFEEMDRMQQQLNSIFNESFGRGMRSRGFDTGSQGSFFEPDIDIREDGDYYIVKIDLPGMEKDNINIEIKDNVLFIAGERETIVEENQGDKFFRQERSYGHFSRSFSLPDDVKENQIMADYKNGVLTVKIARVPTDEEKEKESKKIKVF